MKTADRFTIDEIIETLIWLHEDDDGHPIQEDYSLEEILILFVEAHNSLRSAFCSACDSSVDDEHYMVINDLWKRYGVTRGQLCVGCLEERMGRELTPADFTSAPINDSDKRNLSDRLRSRLTKGTP